MNDPRFAMEGGPNSMAIEMRRNGKPSVADKVVDGFSNFIKMPAWATGTDPSFQSFVCYFGEFLPFFILQ